MAATTVQHPVGNRPSCSASRAAARTVCPLAMSASAASATTTETSSPEAAWRPWSASSSRALLVVPSGVGRPADGHRLARRPPPSPASAVSWSMALPGVVAPARPRSRCRAGPAGPRRSRRAAGPAPRAADRRRRPQPAARAGTRSRSPSSARSTFISTAWRSASSSCVGVEAARPAASSVVRDPAPGDGGDPDHLPGGVVEPVETDQQQVGQVVGQQRPGRRPRRPAPRRRRRCPRRARRCRASPAVGQRAGVQLARPGCARRPRAAARAGAGRRRAAGPTRRPDGAAGGGGAGRRSGRTPRPADRRVEGPGRTGS